MIARILFAVIVAAAFATIIGIAAQNWFTGLGGALIGGPIGNRLGAILFPVNRRG